MQNNTKKIGNHLLYALVDGGTYGLFVYFVSIWLTRYSLLAAYLGNLLLIIIALVLDEFTFKQLSSKGLAQGIKAAKDEEGSSRTIQWIIDSFVSFKTVLYLFYIIILILSQVIEIYPSLIPIGENLESFIYMNRYNILLLVAFDTLIGQFIKDRTRMENVSEQFKCNLAEEQEKQDENQQQDSI
jgi:hypothetical protein